MQMPKVKTVDNIVEIACFCIKLISVICAKAKQKGYEHGRRCPKFNKI